MSSPIRDSQPQGSGGEVILKLAETPAPAHWGSAPLGEAQRLRTRVWTKDEWAKADDRERPANAFYTEDGAFVLAHWLIDA